MPGKTQRIKGEVTMDQHKIDHLSRWVSQQHPGHAEVFDAMIEFLWCSDDWNWWMEQGWWRVYDAAMRSASAD